MAKKMAYETAIGIVDDEFKALVQASGDRSALKSLIVDSQRNIRAQQDFQAEDAQLEAAKEIVKDLGGGYREAIKTQSAKIVVALQRLEELGDA